jgi:ABC-type sugar transport system permease subunit
MRYLASVRIGRVLSTGSAILSWHKTNLRFYGAPLTLAVLALPLALTHHAVSLVWNWQVQKFGRDNHLLNLPKRANGSIARLGRCSQQF